MQINTEYEINDKVIIKPLNNIEGCISGFYYSSEGLKYYTWYRKDFNREYDYFFADEIEKRV